MKASAAQATTTIEKIISVVGMSKLLLVGA
jgi:hypothetical protein